MSAAAQGFWRERDKNSRARGSQQRSVDSDEAGDRYKAGSMWPMLYLWTPSTEAVIASLVTILPPTPNCQFLLYFAWQGAYSWGLVQDLSRSNCHYSEIILGQIHVQRHQHDSLVLFFVLFLISHQEKIQTPHEEERSAHKQ